MMLSSLNRNAACMESIYTSVEFAHSLDLLGLEWCPGASSFVQNNLSFHGNGLCFRNGIIFQFGVQSCLASFKISPNHFFIYIQVAEPCCTLVERCLEDILRSIFIIRSSWLLNTRRAATVLYQRQRALIRRPQPGCVLSPADEQGQTKNVRLAVLDQSTSSVGCVPR